MGSALGCCEECVKPPDRVVAFRLKGHTRVIVWLGQRPSPSVSREKTAFSV